MVERNAGPPPERRIEFRIGIHVGDVVEESDGDLMGDGVNIAARLESIAKPGAICLSEDAYRQVKIAARSCRRDLGSTQLKNIAEPIRVYSLEVGVPAQAKPAAEAMPPKGAKPPEAKKRTILAQFAAAAALLLLIVAVWRLVFPRREPNCDRHLSSASFHRGAALHEPLGRSKPGLFRRRHHGEPHDRPVAHPQQFCDWA